MKTLFRIGFFIAIVAIAAGCKKDDNWQLNITFTDIPAEFEAAPVKVL